ncbi:MAG: hypothetical protein ABFD98_19970 [Syntrophobacteraceae bacterium]|nr:hypothetical protein [Desulfobacteraceae bacterium]
MLKSKSKSGGAILTITLAVLFVLAVAAIAPATADAARRRPMEKIYVVVEPESSCGNRTGSFEARFQGMPITVYFALDRLRVKDGPRYTLRPDRAYNLVCPPPHAHGPNRLTGQRVLVEGRWTGRTEFEAVEIYLPPR